MKNVQMFGRCVLLVVCLGCLPKEDEENATPATPAPANQSAAAKTEVPTASDTSPREREFRFHYRFAVSGLEPGEQARIWLPVPPTNAYQEVAALPNQLPAEPAFHTESKYGNRILYLDASVPKNGELQLDVPYHVKRREALMLTSGDPYEAEQTIDELQRELYLRPNTNVPVTGKPLDLLRDVQLSNDRLKAANQLYELVDKHVAYNKEGTGWGQGDVLWVCDSGRGNCTDFHSLFISLARSQGIPSRFEIGFPIPNADAGSIGGYHCWAWFHVKDRGWIPVDISEADKHPDLRDYYFGSLTPDRVTFSLGRDIQLEPKSAEPSLNFFVYPHIEVNGQPVAREQIALQFSYSAVEDKQ